MDSRAAESQVSQLWEGSSYGLLERFVTQKNACSAKSYLAAEPMRRLRDRAPGPSGFRRLGLALGVNHIRRSGMEVYPRDPHI